MQERQRYIPGLVVHNVAYSVITVIFKRIEFKHFIEKN